MGQRGRFLLNPALSEYQHRLLAVGQEFVGFAAQQQSAHAFADMRGDGEQVAARFSASSMMASCGWSLTM